MVGLAFALTEVAGEGSIVIREETDVARVEL
jgi:hypothetical protein